MKSDLMKNLLVSLVTILIVLILAEIFIRLFVKENLPGYGYPEGFFVEDENLGYKINPGISVNFVGSNYKEIKIDINSNGLRDGNHSYEKKDSRTRILGLGDSLTFGSGVDSSNTYLSQLENLFYENYRPVEVINAGIPGYNIEQELNYLKIYGLRYKPDIIIWGIVVNDIEKDSIKDKVKATNKNEFIKKYCATCSLIYRLTRYNNAYFNLYFNNIYARWDLKNKEWTSTEKNINELSSISRNNDIKLIAVIFPFKEQLYNNSLSNPQKMIKSLLDEKGIEYIDLMDYLKEDIESLYLNGDNLHLTEEGYSIVASALYGKVKPLL